jgi:hypothetical protein
MRSKRFVKQVDYNIKNIQNIHYGGQNKLGRWSHEEHLKFVEGTHPLFSYSEQIECQPSARPQNDLGKNLCVIDSANFL